MTNQCTTQKNAVNSFNFRKYRLLLHKEGVTNDPESNSEKENEYNFLFSLTNTRN